MQNYQTILSKKIPLKIRNGAIDRYFEKFKELPNTLICVKEKKDHDNRNFLIFCQSSNHVAIVCHKDLFNQFIMYDILDSSEMI